VLPLLYNIPKTQNDWNIWSLNHAASHKKILQAIKIQKTLPLSQYSLDPIPFNAFDIFLNNNQQAHNDMLRALGISGADLQQVDVNNENQLRAWVYLHAKEHAEAEMALKV
jgi:hypothetical protein